MPATTYPRIDTLPLLATITIDLGGDIDETAVFLGITGTGDLRTATFAQTDGRGGTFTWNAYRHTGRWCYGTDAQPLRVRTIAHDPTTTE